jgi:hypothetical protein
VDVPHRRAQTCTAGRGARAHGAAAGAVGFEATVCSAAGLSNSPFQITMARRQPLSIPVRDQRATGDVAPATRRPQLELLRFPGPGKRSSSISILCRQARRPGVRCAPRTARFYSPAFCSLQHLARSQFLCECSGGKTAWRASREKVGCR